ncbi:MAG TPA: hypothetical protein DDX39_08150 [Bacteroidales bacterium]|nr:MAG: hypothetical protein A2W98_14805 [Bacteroidetes bacterium GWF2_33_38]OFY91323.1 MAG: hypothetical protein A2236_13705 [Bacteroidetes bacterium RIFOXYA2_FULL_33_7]HBF88599.1 hypothetical protein [Bacteroidales bacterium]
MNPLFQIIINETVRRQIKNKNTHNFQFHKEFRKINVEISHFFKDIFLIILGVMAAGFGLKGFLLPNNFIDGGVTGISMIFSELSNFSLSIFLILINLPFLILGYSTISKQFAIRSAFGIILLAAVVHFIPAPVITEDKLLIAIFGGFFLGLGIGLAIRGGSVIDGTEVLAVFISRKTSLTIGDVILIFNLFIFSIAAYVFSFETALYAILTYLSASKTVDFIVYGIEEYIGVSIISDKSEEIRVAIIEKLGRGCTIYIGKRGYTKLESELKSIDIVYTLITRLELAKLQTEIDKIDPKAFVIMQNVKDAKGGMIKKKPLK